MAAPPRRERHAFTERRLTIRHRLQLRIALSDGSRRVLRDPAAEVGQRALDALLLSPLVLSGVLMLFTGLLVAAKVKVNSPA